MDRLETFTESMELPSEVITGDLKLSVIAGKRALVENHRGILSFESSLVTVAAKKGRLVLRGDGLYLAAMSGDWLVICGKIHAVEWE